MPVELTLQQTTVNHRTLCVFGAVVNALTHLCDHVLTRPESDKWRLLIDQLNTLFPANPDPSGNEPSLNDQLFGFARALWVQEAGGTTQGDAQVLYGQYADEICRSLRDACQHKWCYEEAIQHGANGRTYRHGLGLSGVYVIWDDHRVRTAMFLDNQRPGNLRGTVGDAEYDENGVVEGRQTNPLPRQRPLGAVPLAHQPPRRADRTSPQDQKRRLQRALKDHHQRESYAKSHPPVQDLEGLEKACFQMFKKSLSRVKERIRNRCNVGYNAPDAIVVRPGQIGEKTIPTFEEWRPHWQQRMTQEAA